MTNHYAAPGAPPCRCAYCRERRQSLRTASAVATMRWQLAALIPPTSPTTTDDDANHQQEQVEQERRQREAADLADWLKQDVH